MTSTLLQQAVEARERRAFEEWYEGRSLECGLEHSNWFRLDSDGDYKINNVQSSWRTWLARAALQQQPEPVALSDKQIQDAVFAVLRRWKDDRAWDRYTRESGPYDVSSLRPEVLEIIRAVLAIAPPALQQQEEPREVVLSDARILHLWDAYVGEPNAKYPLNDADKLEFARAVLRAATLAPSPSPQDFTLPMVEEGKGVAGVQASTRAGSVDDAIRAARNSAFESAAQICDKRAAFGSADAWSAARDIRALKTDGRRVDAPVQPDRYYEPMFTAAVQSLAEISKSLGIPDDEAACANGSELIMEAIEELQLRAAPGVDRREEALRRAGAAGLDLDPDVVGDGVNAPGEGQR